MFLGRAFMVKTILGRWVGGKGFSPAGPPKNGIGVRNTKIASPNYVNCTLVWPDFAFDNRIIDTKRGRS